jgi:hypothetical protein
VSCQHEFDATVHVLRLMMAHLYDDYDAFDIAVGELNRCPDCLIRLVGACTEFSASDHTALLLDADLLTNEQNNWVGHHQETPVARRASAEHIASLLGLLGSLRAAEDEVETP